jgi:hypothetical protein
LPLDSGQKVMRFEIFRVIMAHTLLLHLPVLLLKELASLLDIVSCYCVCVCVWLSINKRLGVCKYHKRWEKPTW